LESAQSQFENADGRASGLHKQVTALEGQLSEVQETLAEETKQKLAAQGKVRQTEEELASLREQIEEEEDSKKTLETKIASLSSQVVFILSIFLFFFQTTMGLLYISTVCAEK